MLSLVDASSLCAAEYSISCSIKIKLYSLVLLQNADMVCPEKKVLRENRKSGWGNEKRVNIIKLTLYKVLKVFASMRGNSAIAMRASWGW